MNSTLAATTVRGDGEVMGKNNTGQVKKLLTSSSVTKPIIPPIKGKSKPKAKHATESAPKPASMHQAGKASHQPRKCRRLPQSWQRRRRRRRRAVRRRRRRSQLHLTQPHIPVLRMSKRTRARSPSHPSCQLKQHLKKREEAKAKPTPTTPSWKKCKC